MSNHNTHSTISRQWVLLKKLSNRYPGRTAKELTDLLAEEGYQVSKRQVERDLWELSRLFPIECRDRSRPYGWKWIDRAHLDIPGMTVSEALSWFLVGETLERLLPLEVQDVLRPKLDQARSMLESMPEQGNRMVRWRDKVRVVPPTMPLCAPQLDTQILETVEKGLFDGQQLRIHYTPAQSRTERSYELHPLGLVLRHNVLYLVATHRDYTDPYLYAVHRIRKAESMAVAARQPKDFDLDAYIRQGRLGFGGGEMLELRLKVHPELRTVLEETPLTMEDCWDGEVLTARVPDNWQLRWWLMSQGDRAVVLAPVALRQEMTERFQQALQAYRQA